MAFPLFAEYNPSHIQVPIEESIKTEVIEVHEVRCSKFKCAPSPLIVELPFTTKKTKKKKKWTLKKAGLAATSTAASFPPPPVDFPLDNIPLVELPTLLPCSALMAKGNRDSSNGVVFARSIMLL